MSSNERGSNYQTTTVFGSQSSDIVGASAAELQTPLALIRQLSLALEDTELSVADRQKLAQRLTLTTERALRLTQSLRTGSLAQPLIQLEPVNAATVCHEVVHELSPLFQAHGVAVVAKPRAKSLLMIADRALIKQVIAGFLDNALPYGSSKQPVQLIIGGYQGKVRVGVRDYGPAVNKNVWRQLDNRLTGRASVMVARRPQASGINLLAAKRLAELMGGVAGVTRHRDGATFYVDMKLSGQMSLI